MSNTILVCSQCGCLDCEVTSWVGANTNAISESDAPVEGAWCPVCENSEAELVPSDESPVSFYIFQNDSPVDETFCQDIEGIEDALAAAMDLVLNVWPRPADGQRSIASVCASGNEGKTRAVVATVEAIGPKSKPYPMIRFCQGGEPRVMRRGPVTS